MSEEGPLHAGRRNILVAAVGVAGLAATRAGVANSAPTVDTAPSLKFAFQMSTPTKPAIEIQSAPRRRSIIPLAGGTITGRLNGRILSGESWLETRDDGNVEYLVRYLIEADTGQIISDQATGFIRMADQRGGLYTKTFHHFEAPDGKYSWLNRSAFVGDVVRVEGGRLIRVYEIV